MNSVPLVLQTYTTTALRRAWAACTTLPDNRGWFSCGALFGAYGALALATGFRSGLLRRELMDEPWHVYVLLPGVLFVLPGISEELVFRGLLLPHPSEQAAPPQILVASIVSQAAFFIYHPINGLTLSRKRRNLLTHPLFLWQVALLGAACNLAYLISGSLWPPAFMHWLTVVVWKFFLGGRRIFLSDDVGVR